MGKRKWIIEILEKFLILMI